MENETICVILAVILSDYELIKEISTQPSDLWLDRHTDEWLLERSYGKPLGILFSGGHIWKESRRFILRCFQDFGLGKQSVLNDMVHEELAQLFEHIENVKIEKSTRALNMRHIF